MIHLSVADVTALEEEYVLRALRSGWVAPLGPEVDAFEREIAQRIGVEGALALSSGTAALHLALLSLGVGPGSVVVLPTMTFAASANAVAYTGADLAFVDVLERDGNVDPDLAVECVDELLAEGQRVSALMTVDLYGRSARNAELETAMRERGIPVVEDAAEALGAVDSSGRPAGSFGAAATLSFNGNKIMTTSGGGMLLSNDAELLSRARYLSTQARQPVPWYEHQDVGYNYRLSNLLAALGRAQLVRLDEMVERRVRINRHYRAELGSLPGISFLGDVDDGGNCWLTSAVLDPNESGLSGSDLVEGLNRQQIEARHLWKPMHLQPIWRTRRSALTGVSERLFAQGLNLPSGSSLSDADVERVVQTVRAELMGIS